MPENWFGFCLSFLPSFPSPSLEETNSQLTNNVGAVRVHQRRWWVLRSPRPRAVWFLQMLELSSSSSRSCLPHPGAVCLPHPPAPSGLPRRRPAAPRAAGSSLGAELWKERRPRNTTHVLTLHELLRLLSKVHSSAPGTGSSASLASAARARSRTTGQEEQMLPPARFPGSCGERFRVRRALPACACFP